MQPAHQLRQVGDDGEQSAPYPRLIVGPSHEVQNVAQLATDVSEAQPAPAVTVVQPPKCRHVCGDDVYLGREHPLTVRPVAGPAHSQPQAIENSGGKVSARGAKHVLLTTAPRV